MFKSRIQSAVAFVKDHQTEILVAAVVVTATIAVIQHEGIKSLNEFLEDKGLSDEYYLVGSELEI